MNEGLVRTKDPDNGCSQWPVCWLIRMPVTWGQCMADVLLVVDDLSDGGISGQFGQTCSFQAAIACHQGTRDNRKVSTVTSPSRLDNQQEPGKASQGYEGVMRTLPDSR